MMRADPIEQDEFGVLMVRADPVEQDEFEFQHDGVSYKMIAEVKTWDDAEKNCVKLGGHLATITSEGLNKVILDYLKELQKKYRSNTLWIGFNHKGGKWEPVNPARRSESKIFTKWKAGYPMTGIVDLGNCASFFITGEWFEQRCSEDPKLPSVCEDISKAETGKSNEGDVVSLGPWSKWGRCTEPCDGGTQMRHQECTGPKELCVHRIITQKRDCNSNKCTFPRKEAGGVKYFELNEGMCLSDIDEEGCKQIATATGKKFLEIVNKDIWFFPHGCYVTVSHNYFFYNSKPSTKRCDKDRMCICNLALGRSEVKEWVFGEDNVDEKREVKFPIKEDTSTIPVELMDGL